jgi:hypothetical protein
MYTIKFDGKEAMKMLNNVVSYSNGFIKETKAQEKTIASRLADTSIDAFYDYLDTLARTNPGMLHHVYEWGAVGDPDSRLVELKKRLSGKSAQIDSEFVTSSSIPEGGSEPFYEKAEIMEEGIPITVQAVQAKAMFIQYNGDEFFTAGPIVIENPGGEGVRGSFVAAFEEFYNTYFDQVYLRAIRFYQHFENPKGFESNFNSAVNSGNAAGIGRTTALKWVMNMPGGENE